MKKIICLLITIAFLLVFNGCTSTQEASKPVYPTLDKDVECSTLRFNNKISDNPLLNYPRIQVEVDGFSPTPNLYLQEGITELRLSPGTHQITHKAEYNLESIYYFNPVSSHINLEKGKTYTITFEYLVDGAMRFGYKIDYEGWDNEEKLQWPEKNIIANPLW